MSPVEIVSNVPAAAPLPNMALALRHEIELTDFAAMLPAHVSEAKFRRTVLTALSENPKLYGCDKKSVLSACMRAANDGLLPNAREAAIVPFNDKKRGVVVATYIPMVAGVYKLLRNSGELASIQSNVVYEQDVFDYALGDESRITHKPAMGERGKAIGVYAIALLKGGFSDREFMSFAEVERIRSFSRAKDEKFWTQHWGEMARKTVVKRLAKRLPLSTDREYSRDDDDEPRDVTLPAPRPTRAEFLDPPADPEPTVEGAPETGELIDDSAKSHMAEMATPPTAVPAAAIYFVPLPGLGDGTTVDGWLEWRNAILDLFVNQPIRWPVIEAANRDNIARSPHRVIVAEAIEAAKRVAALAGG